MPPESSEATALAIVVEQLKFLRTDVKDLSTKLDKSNENKVSHREWSQRNEHVNNRLAGLGREIGDLRTEIRAKSAPWWSVGAFVVALVAVAWNVLGPS